MMSNICVLLRRQQRSWSSKRRKKPLKMRGCGTDRFCSDGIRYCIPVSKIWEDLRVHWTVGLRKPNRIEGLVMVSTYRMLSGSPMIMGKSMIWIRKQLREYETAQWHDNTRTLWKCEGVRFSIPPKIFPVRLRGDISCIVCAEWHRRFNSKTSSWQRRSSLGIRKKSCRNMLHPSRLLRPYCLETYGSRTGKYPLPGMPSLCNSCCLHSLAQLFETLLNHSTSVIALTFSKLKEGVKLHLCELWMLRFLWKMSNGCWALSKDRFLTKRVSRADYGRTRTVMLFFS
jgi:hypothetical protein